MQVIVDDLLVDYARSGSGQVVLLLHGWGDRVFGLQTLQQALEKQFDVIIPDLPGFGGSQTPAEVWGLDDYAAFLAAFLKKIGVKNVYALIGHSNGGAIAVRGLANKQLAADRLVLLASAGIRGTYKGRVKAVRYITKLGKMLVTPLPSGVKKKLRQKVYKTVGSDMLVAEQLQETFKKIITDDIKADAAKLSLPALLIYGNDDTQTPVSYGETLHGLIKGSKFEIIPGAGHFVHLEKHQEVMQLIKGFLK
jgi:pimeloyl-ACP methyl ester carboxylesterase